MSYTALYRKFRPGGFDDVKGQDHIVTTLKNQIKSERAGHAYLFCGTRGTGKTSIAKILAKAVNCENPADGSPCNECSMCRAINAQTSMNVIEIDAASNNGVDNIREIIDEVQYSPTEGKYKVYIIDEVHMLSTGAFNALLKTLEEPPSYVIFILATTEVHKIPITILSRCQRYDFKRITIDTISSRLTELMDKEGIETEEKAVRYVAKAADGSMRDALSLLDQCIAFYLGEKLTYDKVLDVLGAVDVEVFSRLFGYISAEEVVPCLELLEEMITAGRELGQFVTDFTWYLRNMLLVKTSDQSMDMVDVSTEHMKVLKKEAAAIEAGTLLRYIRIFSELSNQIKYAAQKRVLVEIAFIKLCCPAMETNYDSILDRIRVIEKQLERGMPVHEAAAAGKRTEHGEERTERTDTKAEVLEKAVSEEIKEAAANWTAIIAKVSPAVRAMLTGARPSPGEDNTLVLVFEDEVQRNFMNREEHLTELTQVIEENIHKTVVIKTKLLETGKESIEDVVDLTKVFRMPVEIEE